jgi:hypothetical protein
MQARSLTHAGTVSHPCRHFAHERRNADLSTALIFPNLSLILFNARTQNAKFTPKNRKSRGKSENLRFSPNKSAPLSLFIQSPQGGTRRSGKAAAPQPHEDKYPIESPKGRKEPPNGTSCPFSYTPQPPATRRGRNSHVYQ